MSWLFAQPFFFQAQIKGNIKAPRHWLLWGEFTGGRWIPRTKDQQRGKCFHLVMVRSRESRNVVFVWIFCSLWNLTISVNGTSVKFQSGWTILNTISRFRGFARSYDEALYVIWKRYRIALTKPLLIEKCCFWFEELIKNNNETSAMVVLICWIHLNALTKKTRNQMTIFNKMTIFVFNSNPKEIIVYAIVLTL